MRLGGHKVQIWTLSSHSGPVSGLGLQCCFVFVYGPRGIWAIAVLAPSLSESNFSTVGNTSRNKKLNRDAQRQNTNGAGSKFSQTQMSTNNLIQICCTMLSRRPFCGYGIIHEAWFLLRRYWPIPQASCNSPTFPLFLSDTNTHIHTHALGPNTAYDASSYISSVYIHAKRVLASTLCINAHTTGCQGFRWQSRWEQCEEWIEDIVKCWVCVVLLLLTKKLFWRQIV